MSYFEETVAFLGQQIKDVIKNIEKSQAKIACVVDDDRILKGVVTDGDIRRGLINGIQLSEPIEKIMHEGPITVSPSEAPETVKKLMKEHQILYIPVVENGRLVNLYCPSDFEKKESKANAVLIMAGGFGKRLGNLTDSCPKPLLDIGGKPILETIIDRFKKNGFNRFFISVHYKAEMITDYFSDGSRFGVSIKYLYEDSPLGTAGPLGFLKKEKDTILMINGDVLTKVEFDNLLDFHRQKESELTMCAHEYGFQVPYGVIKYKGHKVTKIVEKPTQKFFVNAGVYAIEPSLLGFLDEGENIDMNVFVEKAISKKSEVNVYPLHEYWQDIGQKEQFDQAQVDYSKQFKD
jgi:dTDP-glucose pyrophosphorylase